MKTMFKYASLLFVSGALLVTSCKKKSDDAAVTPAETPPPATGETVCLDGKKTQVLIDASTKSSATSYIKGYECTVTTSQGTDTIVLDVKAPKDLDKIFITLSTDNGAAVPFLVPQDLVGFDPATPTYNKTFKKGVSGDYSLDIPDGLSKTNYIKVKIPVSVRTSPAAMSDVYTIWFTNGTGDFTNTGKKTVIGPLNVALVYGAGVPYIPGTGIAVGDQNADGIPSYVSTSGSINTILGASLISNDLSDEEKTVALNGADLNFVSLTSDGKEIQYRGTPHLIGVGTRTSVKLTTNLLGTDVTKFAAYTGTKTFDSFNGGDIKDLPTPTADRIKVETGKIYVFLTSDGRKGIVRTYDFAQQSEVAAVVAARLEAGGNTAKIDIKVLTK